MKLVQPIYSFSTYLVKLDILCNNVLELHPFWDKGGTYYIYTLSM
jgi:hypothetical protein